MSIPVNATCYLCHFNKHVETALSLGDEATATAFARDLMQIYLNAAEDTSSPVFTPLVSELYQKYYGLDPDRFKEEKEASNRFALARIGDIAARVEAAPDRLYAGLQFALLGNYIDFSALHGQVSFAKLDELLDKAQHLQVEQTAYEALKADLQAGKKLLYITDNAGEICFDRVFAEEITRAYPHLEITFCVRGGPSQNDATRADAELAGISFPIIDNGNLVAGTELSQLSLEAKNAMDQADVIIAKGQGNTETLYGCGYNIYYAFLVKCIRFQQMFKRPQLTPMLLREKELTKMLQV